MKMNQHLPNIRWLLSGDIHKRFNVVHLDGKSRCKKQENRDPNHQWHR